MPEDQWALYRSGCAVTDDIRRYTKIMMLTCLGYFIIQASGQGRGTGGR
jgi:hypothetical protein